MTTDIFVSSEGIQVSVKKEVVYLVKKVAKRKMKDIEKIVLRYVHWGMSLMVFFSDGHFVTSAIL